MKTTTLTGIEPIPVEYILGVAQTKATDAQRRPYVQLIERWGEEKDCIEETHRLLMLKCICRLGDSHLLLDRIDQILLAGSGFFDPILLYGNAKVI